MLTLSSEYALRAMVLLARHADEWPVSAQHIAEQSGIPRKYLSKILADLARAGLLEGSRGKRGGFRMTRSPKEIRLFEVLAPFEPVLTHRRSCPFGNVVCGDDDPCAGHHRWKPVREAYQRFLSETTVHDVAVKKSEFPEGRSKQRVTQ